MSRWTDHHYLREEQYRAPDNLDARAALHRRFSANDYPWQRWVFDQFHLPTEARVLELGCGPGDLWAANRARVPARWDLILTDLSSGMVWEARKRLGTRGARFVYATVDAQSLPFRPQSFDAVIANHVLYHVPRRHLLLHEVHRVLVSEGRFYAATNGMEHLQELRELVSRFVPGSDTADVVEPFCLENGESQLREIYSNVRLFRQENSLVVTEPDAIVDYVRSYVSDEPGDPGLNALASWVRRHVATHGAFTISKDAGMFVAVKPLGGAADFDLHLGAMSLRRLGDGDTALSASKRQADRIRRGRRDLFRLARFVRALSGRVGGTTTCLTNTTTSTSPSSRRRRSCSITMPPLTRPAA